MNLGHKDAVDNGVEAVFLKLLGYCRQNNWAGYDPYDALNSRLFQVLPFLNSNLPRLALTQALKRSPINIRRLLSIPKTENPKATALFLSALLRLPYTRLSDRHTLIQRMIESLIALKSPSAPYWCWGYSFPWQTRRELVPSGAPNLVCTTFVANALLDAHDQRCDERSLGMAVNAAEYILDELYWTDGDSISSFSYPLPSFRVQVHNANFLAAALLCRVYMQTGDEKYLVPALKAARCSAALQQSDGSWYYAEAPSHRWIDNFHTGYNLCALQSISRYAETTEFDSCIQRGFEFYRSHFFHEGGAVRYFHDQTYPVDIHCVAQSIITLLTFQHLGAGNFEMAKKVFQWSLKHMWDDRGFFYYRVLSLCTIRTSYMRWSQAWMLLALSSLLSESLIGIPHRQREDSRMSEF